MITSKVSVQEMAREYRKDPSFKDLQVILVKNISDGTAGIDYRAEDGKTHWFPVRGFIRKPVDANKVNEEIKKHINYDNFIGEIEVSQVNENFEGWLCSIVK